MAHEDLPTHTRNCLNHLLRLYKAGAHRGASGGEKQARRVVRAILADVPGLDGDAQDGLRALINGVAAAPQAARDLFGYEPD